MSYEYLKEYKSINLTIVDLFRRQLSSLTIVKISFKYECIFKVICCLQLDGFSNRISNVFQKADYQKGDLLAVVMGVITALINTNLRNQPVVHCIKTASVRAVMYSEEFESIVMNIAHDIGKVKSKRDRAFLSSDLLGMYDLGSLYFKDRTGDTFKWKGENVSTTKVKSIIFSAAGHGNVIVYGVEGGNLEGRAGVTAIVDPDFQLDIT
ncbi:hypothetical protein RUM44_003296 [Polyplax serrata]|uniref:Uncharacterized protein n=1 Tax=Polyplax serrata TaxID=468196 RepID=A0ABR1AG11_POLSC